ncbi:MAG: hypothetical protein Q4C73_05870 [Eubacteriales bacterium]|nr:hypothetical protein [Eubacteriales bacterium]
MRQQKDSSLYEDMLELPHHVSGVHPQMSIRDRAAQFAPFAALSGHSAAIRETARLTEEAPELEEAELEILDRRLRFLRERLQERHGFSLDGEPVRVLYFQPDGRKAGGRYVSCTGVVKKLQEYEGLLIMEDNTRIPIRDIAELEGELFEAAGI